MPSGYTLGNMGPSYNGLPMKGSQPDISGTTFYVDFNSGNDANHGQSWEKPFKTLEKAISVSNIDISKKNNVMKRNTIFIVGSSAQVTCLTVFPTKCDVIGVGGSDNSNMATIYGYHIPNVTSTINTRFFNIYFKNSGTGNNVITLNATTSGCEFHGCMIDGGTNAVNGINIIYSPSFVAIGCKIVGTFSNANILIGEGEMTSVYIRDCDLVGSTYYGIKTDYSMTAYKGAYIINNRIHGGHAEGIRDSSNKCTITNNRVFTGAPRGVAAMGCIVCNTYLAQDNRVTCADASSVNAVFPAEGTL